jgi:hypothetical protein
MIRIFLVLGYAFANVTMTHAAVLNYADIILGGPDVIYGVGFGSDPRILTIQNTGTESGCNSWSGGSMTVGASACDSGLGNAGGDEPNPHSSPKFTIPTLSSLSITNAGQIGIAFNATQPGGGPITIEDLVLKFYSSSGTLLVTESLANPSVPLASTVPGNGKTDFLFVLDP